MDPRFKIRKARSGDIDRVIFIENQQFPHPWKKSFFESELTHNLAWFYVLENTANTEVVGYIIFWVIEETIELHNIAVDAQYKGKGLGKQLFGFLLETAGRKNAEEVFLEVRQSNKGAVGFYQHLGFEQISIREDYYNDPLENALIFRMNLV